VRLRAGDIDSEQKIIRIVQSKSRKDRHVMRPAQMPEPLPLAWTSHRQLITRLTSYLADFVLSASR
jgi:hypothetical protein